MVTYADRDIVSAIGLRRDRRLPVTLSISLPPGAGAERDWIADELAAAIRGS